MTNTDDDNKSVSPSGGAPLSSGSSPSPTPKSQDPVITLKVGEQTFQTKAETLQESGYPKALTSGRWESNKQNDCSYFIDADPALFAHILRYLRRGVLPIFYDKVKGHDHALYLALLEEARYFQIQRLQKWLEEKRFLRAMMVSTTTRDEGESIVGCTESKDSNKQFEIYPLMYMRKVYLCPRRIDRHKGDPDSCGRQCRNAQAEGGPEYVDEPCMKIVSVTKETIFDRQACLEGQGDFSSEE
jgi:hypothetical protein